MPLIDSLAGKTILGVPFDKVSVLRLDRLGGAAPGNKSFKLQHNLARAKQRGARRVLSFGGGWSNHLHALAAVGAELGMETIGVVRGGETATAMLADAERWGMRLVAVSREEYRRRGSPEYQAELAARFGGCMVIPEGGANVDGLLGCREIAALAEAGGAHWDRVLVAVGTGTTLAGLAAGLRASGEVVGVSALKGAADSERRIEELLAAADLQARLPWRVEQAYHCGGFARMNGELAQFIPAFEAATGIPLEPVYTGKLFLALYDKLRTGTWGSEERVLAIHSGGLQGRRGYPGLPPMPID